MQLKAHWKAVPRLEKLCVATTDVIILAALGVLMQSSIFNVAGQAKARVSGVILGLVVTQSWAVPVQLVENVGRRSWWVPHRIPQGQRNPLCRTIDLPYTDGTSVEGCFQPGPRVRQGFEHIHAQSTTVWKTHLRLVQGQASTEPISRKGHWYWCYPVGKSATSLWQQHWCCKGAETVWVP